MKLYGYFRSSAAFRVRIALNLKGIECEHVPVSLVQDGQHTPEYRDLNPQALVPVLQDDDFTLSQSLAIIEYLDERWPEPSVLPGDARQRAFAHRLAHVVASEIHPLNNLRVRFYLEQELGVSSDAAARWYRHWIDEGFRAMEAMIGRAGHGGGYCAGDAMSLADICLVPQMYNARRFDCPLDAFPRLVDIDARCRELPAVAAAMPERQADAQ